MLYAIVGELTRRVKFGYSDGGTPVGRLRQLQIGSPDKLHVLAYCQGSRRLEARLHNALKVHRVHGEWFSTELLELLTDKLAAGQSFEDWILEQTASTPLSVRRDSRPDARAPRTSSHGTRNEYNYGCRCEACRRANADHAFGYRQPACINPTRCGVTTTNFQYGCRCEPCKDNWYRKQRERERSKRERR